MENKKVKIGFYNGVIVLSIILVVSAIIYINHHSINTMTVYRDTIENKIYETGMITCYSTPLIANANGEALFVYEEGKIVLPYVKLATLYSGVLDEKTKAQLRTLNNKITLSNSIQNYKQNIYTDIGSMNREINKTFINIASDTADGNYKNVYDYKNDVLTYNGKIMENKGIAKKESGTANLSTEVANLEKSISATKKTYTSPVAGLFSTKVDSLDEVLTPDIARTLTPSTYKELADKKITTYNDIVQGRIFAKVINHFEWYLVADVSVEELKGLSVGSTIEVRVINNSNLKVEATIETISAEENGKVVIVLKSTKYIENIYTSKNVEFELVKSTVSGLKIPNESIVEQEGAKGVYVVKDGMYRFVKVEILYEDKNYVLIQDLSSEVIQEKEHVILYDLVVVNPNSVKEGDIAS